MQSHSIDLPISSYCLALYGCELWNISSPGLRSLEVVLNNCLRRIWRLPPRTHTGILHRCARVQSIYNLVSSRSLKFIKNAKNNLNTLVKRVFSEDLAYSFSGHNIFCGRTYMKEYSTDDEKCAVVLRDSSSTVICQGSSSIDNVKDNMMK